MSDEQMSEFPALLYDIVVDLYMKNPDVDEWLKAWVLEKSLEK